MKFALVNVYYKHGSTGKGIKRNYDRLKSYGHEVKVFYGAQKQDDGNSDAVFIGNRYFNYFHMLCSKYLGLDGLLSNISTTKLLRHLKRYQPDVVWLSGLHGYYVNWYRLIKFLKKNDIRTVYGMVDEFAFLGKCCSSFDCEKYKTGCHHCPYLKHYPQSFIFDNSKLIFNLKKKAYRGWDKVVFRSAPYVVNKAKGSYLLKDKQFAETDSSVDITNIYHPRNSEKLRQELGIPENKKVALLCARSTDAHKGAQYFEECARLCEHDDIVFVQVAFNGNKETLPSNFIPISYVSSPELLAEYYSMADVYVCTSVSDAQPNACLEAMGCGTPIVGFNISGVPYVAPKEFGTFIEPFDVQKMAEAIRNLPRKTEASIKACHEYAKQRFSVEATNGVHAAFVAEICQKVMDDKKGQ
ncbi:MAG: glycosyltransferase [Oscillospiraceae bacterium]|nr:glycosyltransferase [Oscillospiraceae bacterium]